MANNHHQGWQDYRNEICRRKILEEKGPVLLKKIIPRKKKKKKKEKKKENKDLIKREPPKYKGIEWINKFNKCSNPNNIDSNIHKYIKDIDDTLNALYVPRKIQLLNSIPKYNKLISYYNANKHKIINENSILKEIKRINNRIEQRTPSRRLLTL